MSYTADYSKEARNYLRKSRSADQRRLIARVEALCEDPFDSNLSKRLHGDLEGARSSRVGELRIVFEVLQQDLLISVVRIGPRGDVYRP